MAGEEIGAGAPRRGFGGHGLGAVLAELEARRMVAVWPGAARAVEAVGLVGRQQGARALERDVVAQQRVLHAAQRAPAACRAGVELNFLLVHRVAGLD